MPEVADERFRNPLLATSSVHLGFAKPAKRIAQGQIKQEGPIERWCRPQEVQFGRPERDPVREPCGACALTVLKAWSDFCDDYVAVSEVGVAGLSIGQRPCP